MHFYTPQDTVENMTATEKILFAVGVLVCFSAVFYGIWLYYTVPVATLDDVVALLFLVLPGTVCLRRVLDDPSPW